MSKFTETQTKTILDTYSDALQSDYSVRTAVVDALASELGVTVPQVRGVLVAAKVYLKKEASAKGASGAVKVDYVKAFQAVTTLSLASMDNMTKTDLIALWDWHVQSFDQALAEVGK